MIDTVHFSIKFEEQFQDSLIDILRKQIPVVNEFIMRDYDLMLNGVDTNRDSKVKPEYYEDDFRKLLNDLPEDFYIKNTDTVGYVVFMVPDVTSLDLSSLPLLQLIFEGLPGRYVTASRKQFKDAGEKVGSRRPLNPEARRDDMVYLIRYTQSLRKRMEFTLNLGRGLPPYAFSNMKGIDIFETADTYIVENADIWIDEAKEITIAKLEGVYS